MATLRFRSGPDSCAASVTFILLPWLEVFPNTFKACGEKKQQLEDFKPTAWVTVSKVKRVGIAKVSCFLVMDKRPQRVTKKNR